MAAVPALLVAWSGTRPLSRIVDASSGVVLGRSLLADTDDDRMSREHARVAFTSGQWTVADLGSSNGTIVDGRSITRGATVPLRPFAVVRTGHTIAIPIDDASAIAGDEPGVTVLPGAIAGRSTAALHARLVDASRSGASIVIGGEPGSGRRYLAEVYAKQLEPRRVRIARDPEQTEEALNELLDPVARDPDLRLVVTQNHKASPFKPRLAALLRERAFWFELPPLRQRADELAQLIARTVASIDVTLVCQATLLEHCLLAKDNLRTLVSGLIDMARIHREQDRRTMGANDLVAAMRRNWVQIREPPPDFN